MNASSLFPQRAIMPGALPSSLLILDGLFNGESK